VLRRAAIITILPSLCDIIQSNYAVTCGATRRKTTLLRASVRQGSWFYYWKNVVRKHLFWHREQCYSSVTEAIWSWTFSFIQRDYYALVLFFWSTFILPDSRQMKLHLILWTCIENLAGNKSLCSCDYGYIVWNAHNTVFDSKRSAICVTVKLSYNVFFKLNDLHGC